MIKFENLGMGNQKFFVKLTNRGESKLFKISCEGVKNFSNGLRGGFKIVVILF